MIQLFLFYFLIMKALSAPICDNGKAYIGVIKDSANKYSLTKILSEFKEYNANDFEIWPNGIVYYVINPDFLKGILLIK
jgi:hypothetical protein